MNEGSPPTDRSWEDREPSPGDESLGSQASSGAPSAVEDLIDEVEATEPRPSVVARGVRGNVAIVTGASSGIGRAVAVALAGAGAHIAFNFLDDGDEPRRGAAETAELIRRQGVRAFWRAVDCRVPAHVNAFVEETVARLGGVHILVNNAGVGRDRALWRMSDEEWTTVIETNLSGTFHFLRAVSPLLRAQEDGKIVNIASVHGIRSEFGLANYAASKGGILALTRSAAVELGPSNVNVNAVAPGYIRTPQLTRRVPAEILDRVRERSALGRLGDPQDVAETVLFLCSEAARHITGVVIPVDGGYLL